MPEFNIRQNVTFASNGREAFGYLRKPAGDLGPGVIVIQEWWGLTDHIADITDRFAAEGFVALAPDLYGGRVAHDAEEAGRLMSGLPVEQAAADLLGSVDALLADPDVTSSTVGVVGFCMGGGFVLQLAALGGDKVGAAVPFYGVGPAVPDNYRTLSAAVQGHYGELDTSYPVERAREQERQIRDEGTGPVEFFYYPAGHAFHNDQRPTAYHRDSAEAAWSRTLDHLRKHLG
ncbi:dienelactone hydrolase family protein [Gordonia sp. LSe1-13]|uniref:Dienelactone hydrolase family protein n=1 Tax=Gordonia sesuvii TaxID=3116777 RepID=A0ABU7MJ10_9ACTN|nr:dienelactone hydrolase family protein [Gordonia sp. LSe1-13]